MAKEITIGTTLNANKNGASLNRNDSTQIDMAGSTFIQNVQTISASTGTVTLDMGSVTSPGFVRLKNVDPTNFVCFSLTSGATASNAFCTLRPGEHALIPTRQTNIYARADTAAVNVEVMVASL